MAPQSIEEAAALMDMFSDIDKQLKETEDNPSITPQVDFLSALGTIDLDEMQTETWADLLPGKPISPLIHQVILRDASVNNGMMLYDLVPERYRR